MMAVAAAAGGVEIAVCSVSVSECVCECVYFLGELKLLIERMCLWMHTVVFARANSCKYNVCR